METSYAVKWREPGGRTFLGRLVFTPQALVLEGRNGDERGVTRTIGFDEVRGFRVGRAGDERLDGQPTLVIERAGGDWVITSKVVHAGVLQELIDRLAQLRLEAPRRATVVLPLKEGTEERARRMAMAGPPFDPAETSLTRHQLLLTPAEAIFIFEAESDLALDGLLGQLNLWAAAAAWGEIIAGPPRLAELVYGWERPPSLAVGLGLTT